MIFNKAFDAISESDLTALVETRIPEGRQLEYKRDHYGRTDDAKREFAADVSAMANAQGGDLLIGIAEENGIATEVTGIEATDVDALVLAVTESIRSSIEPPLPSVRVRWVEMTAGRGVLHIRVDRSWSGPHRVTVARDNRFFVRDENGKHPMSVSELRRAFLLGSEVEERIRRFRTDRLMLLGANEGPLALRVDQPQAIVHVIPQITFTEGFQIAFQDNRAGLCPMGATGWNSLYSLDGLVSYSGPEGRLESVRAFSTLFRIGVIEAVGHVYAGTRGEHRSISLTGVEQGVMQATQNGLRELSHYDVPPPYYLMLSLIGVRGLSAPVDEWGDSFPYPHRADRVLLPEIMVDEILAKKAPSSWLRPVFNLLWNAFGQNSSPSYDHDGNYVGR